MNWDQCPDCREPVAVELDCENPKCIAAAKERREATARGRMAFNTFHATQRYKPMWDQISRRAQALWIEASRESLRPQGPYDNALAVDAAVDAIREALARVEKRETRLRELRQTNTPWVIIQREVELLAQAVTDLLQIAGGASHLAIYRVTPSASPRFVDAGREYVCPIPSKPVEVAGLDTWFEPEIHKQP